jgi:hypothetical protein
VVLPVTGEVKVTSDEQRMVVAINKYRESFKLPPLKVDAILLRVARHRVRQFNHHAFGQWSWEEARQAGFDGPVTDNLSQGDESPEDCVFGWGTWEDRREARTHEVIGHDHQLRGERKLNGKWLDCHFNVVGVAHAGNNYIAIFGRTDE